MISRFMIAMFLSVTLASVSQVLLKKSSLNKYSSIFKEYMNLYVLCGYGLLFISMFLTIYAYSGMDYKNGPMIESFGNVMVLFLSYFIFKEKISARKLTGISFIIMGIVVFNL